SGAARRPKGQSGADGGRTRPLRRPGQHGGPGGGRKLPPQGEEPDPARRAGHHRHQQGGLCLLRPGCGGHCRRRPGAGPMKPYILAIDQSTQGTKGVVFDGEGTLLARADRPHAQKIDANGWVEHDPREILQNTLAVARAALEKAGVDPADLAAVGISNQRETVLAWDRTTGQPLYSAIIWQCGRAKDLCARLADAAPMVRQKTGLPLSPYFSAPKLAWMLEHIPAVRQAADAGTLCCGTVDSWLLWNLTRERVHRTDYSNASRTGLFNIHTLRWDEELCALYGVPVQALPQVYMSDGVFGTTDLGGFLGRAVPICGVLGDSHGALLGQGCFAPGTAKATYGTGSSVMMQTGDACIESTGGLVTSLAWGLSGRVNYVLEGNLNYTG